MDARGTYLSVCPWGGWRIAKHDQLNSMYGKFLEEAGNDACWAQIEREINDDDICEELQCEASSEPDRRGRSRAGR